MANKLTYFGITVGDWTPAKECELDARSMRHKVTEFNNLYGSDENHKYYIVSSVSGYKMTRNLKEIREQIEHDERLAKRRLGVISKRRKNLERFETLRAHGGRKTHE